MLVCDVSAIDKLIDMYGENLSVQYNLSLIHISEPTDRTRSRMPSSA